MTARYVLNARPRDCLCVALLHAHLLSLSLFFLKKSTTLKKKNRSEVVNIKHLFYSEIQDIRHIVLTKCCFVWLFDSDVDLHLYNTRDSELGVCFKRLVGRATIGPFRRRPLYPTKSERVRGVTGEERIYGHRHIFFPHPYWTSASVFADIPSSVSYTHLDVYKRQCQQDDS